MHLSNKQADATFLGHPKGLFTLFLTELWERFSFYGMRAILVLFLVDSIKGGLGFSEAAALKLYGIYTMAVYVLGILGGVLADRYLGQRAAVLWGGILACIGHFLLALSIEATVFIVGLGLIATGTGLLKPNISTMVGGLYQPGDARRDSGFTIFYMGINIGALLASLIVGFVGGHYGWHYGFSLAGFGILIGLITFVAGKSTLGEIGTKTEQKTKVAASNLAPTQPAFTKEEKDRLSVILICLIAISAFFVAFEQCGGLMNLYASKYTNRHILGWEVPAGMFQSLNPAFIILLGPIIPLLWTKLAKHYKNTSSIAKMGTGNIIVGLGFLFMIGAVLQRQSDPTGQSSPYWLVGAYLFHTIGELCLSPVALSFITKVAPERVQASMMGLFFASVGIAHWIAGFLGAQIASWGELSIFKLICVCTVLIGLPFIIFNKQLSKLTHGSEQPTQKDA